MARVKQGMFTDSALHNLRGEVETLLTLLPARSAAVCLSDLYSSVSAHCICFSLQGLDAARHRLGQTYRGELIVNITMEMFCVKWGIPLNRNITLFFFFTNC